MLDYRLDEYYVRKIVLSEELGHATYKTEAIGGRIVGCLVVKDECAGYLLRHVEMILSPSCMLCKVRFV